MMLTSSVVTPLESVLVGLTENERITAMTTGGAIATVLITGPVMLWLRNRLSPSRPAHRPGARRRRRRSLADDLDAMRVDVDQLKTSMAEHRTENATATGTLAGQVAELHHLVLTLVQRETRP